MQSAAPKRIRTEVKTALASFGHIFNLGHGIHTDINPDHVLALVEAARGAIKRYHQKPQGKRAHPKQALVSAARSTYQRPLMKRQEWCGEG